MLKEISPTHYCGGKMIWHMPCYMLSTFHHLLLIIRMFTGFGNKAAVFRLSFPRVIILAYKQAALLFYEENIFVGLIYIYI